MAESDTYTEAPVSRTAATMPELTLSNAQKTIQFFQEEPQWLANPRTAHAANAIFGQASKIVGMGIQLDRVNAQADAARLKLNTDTRLIQHLNDGVAKLQDLSVLAEIRDEVNSNGPSPRAISLLNTALAKQQSEDAQRKQDIRTDGQIQVVGAKSEAVDSHIEKRHEYQSDLAKQRFGFQKDILDRKEFTADLNMEIKTRLKRMDEKFTDSQKEIDELRKAGVTDEDPRMLKAIGQQAILGIRQNEFLDKIRPAPRNAASNAPAASAPAAPPAAATAPSAPAPDELIDAVNPSGKSVRIRKSQSDEAVKAGYNIQ